MSWWHRPSGRGFDVTYPSLDEYWMYMKFSEHLWSASTPPESSAGAELDRRAERISARPKRDLKNR